MAAENQGLDAADLLARFRARQSQRWERRRRGSTEHGAAAPAGTGAELITLVDGEHRTDRGIPRSKDCAPPRRRLSSEVGDQPRLSP